MKPFNLEEAIKGAKLITRYGIKVDEFHCFETLRYKANYPLVAIINKVKQSYTAEGKYNYSGKESEMDLFMAPEKKEYWVNLFRTREGKVAVGNNILWESKEQAVEARAGLQGHITDDPIKIWEEEI